MTASAKYTGTIDVTSADFPILAVNVLDRLGYTVSRASKQLNQILAIERLDERVGRDWWHHEYRVLLQWSEISSHIVINIEIIERKGGGTNSDCETRCHQIIKQLQNDALRAKTVASTKEKSVVHGSASWGTEEELRKSRYICKKPEPTRLILGKTKDSSEYICVPELVTHSHALVCGRTGVGKTRGFFIPNLIERLGINMIVTEATPGYEAGELYSLTSGWRKQAGHQIYCFNPSDMTSTRINPIDRIRLAPDDMKVKEAEKLADLIILNGQHDEARLDPTWDRSEKQLLTSLLLHTAATDPELGHIGAIRWLLLSGIEETKYTLNKSPSQLAQMEFEGWLGATSENFRFGVLAGLMTKLNPWITDQLVTLTEKTDFDLQSLKNDLFTFYLAVPSRSHDSKLVGSLIMNFLLDYLLDNRSDMRYQTALFLDEFTNFGKIANIADVLSIIRKARISLVLGFQNYHQLERTYSRKEAQIIFDQPATQVYFRQKNFHEAKALSEALGRTTVEEITVTDTGRVHEFLQGRALATPDELIKLKNEVIVFTNDTPPLKLPLFPPDAYSSALTYPSPDRQRHQVTRTIRERGKNLLKEKQSKNYSQNHKDDSNKQQIEIEDQRNIQSKQEQDIAEQTSSSTRSQTQRPEMDDIWEI
jgi:type IV secretory pathway TraG/TraD family ATPase VirD4